jgi:hypothetical protein
MNNHFTSPGAQDYENRKFIECLSESLLLLSELENRNTLRSSGPDDVEFREQKNGDQLQQKNPEGK